MSSSLDGLFSHFPIIIVKRWNEIFEKNALVNFKNKIISKFGVEPFNEKMNYKLSLDFWGKLIRSGKSLSEFDVVDG